MNGFCGALGRVLELLRGRGRAGERGQGGGAGVDDRAAPAGAGAQDAGGGDDGDEQGDSLRGHDLGSLSRRVTTYRSNTRRAASDRSLTKRRFDRLRRCRQRELSSRAAPQQRHRIADLAERSCMAGMSARADATMIARRGAGDRDQLIARGAVTVRNGAYPAKGGAPATSPGLFTAGSRMKPATASSRIRRARRFASRRPTMPGARGRRGCSPSSSVRPRRWSAARSGAPSAPTSSTTSTPAPGSGRSGRSPTACQLSATTRSAAMC